MKPNDVSPAWPSESAVDRATECLMFLCAHGFVTPSQKTSIGARIRWWFERAAQKKHGEAVQP